MNDKPIYVWFSSQLVNDRTRPHVYMVSALLSTIFMFLLAFTIALTVLCINYPFFPMPTNNQPAWFHVLAFFKLAFGMVSPAFQFEGFRTYARALIWWESRGEVYLIVIRWILALIAGGAGAWLFGRKAFKPVEQSRQVRGRKLWKGKEGFAELKRSFDAQASSAGASYIIASNKGLGFNVLDAKSFADPKDVIYMPDPQRRGHCFYIGGSRRGKGVTTKKVVMQMYYHNIRRKFKPLNDTPYKLFIVDTPKGEYASLFKKRHALQITTDEKYMTPHAISLDLELTQDVAQFVAGMIPVSDKDSFWGNAARSVATGIGAFLCAEAKGLWGYSHFAYFKDLPPEEIAALLKKYYPESNQILAMGEQPLSSIMGTLAASLGFMNDVARIWEGYDYKKEIHQMTAAMLKLQFWQEWFLDKFLSIELTEENKEDIFKKSELISSLKTSLADTKKGTSEDKDKEIAELEENIRIEERLKQRIFDSKNGEKATLAILDYHFKDLTKSNPDWQWVDLKERLLIKWADQVSMVTRDNPKLDIRIFDRSNIKSYIANIEVIVKWAKIWDAYETRPKFSMREWLYDENPQTKIVIMKPSGRFNNQLDGIIKGLLYYMKSTINDKYFKDDKKNGQTVRNLHMVLDEFQNLGNVKEFIEPALEMFASKGVTVHLCCQDFSQLKAIYQEEFLKFVLANTMNIYIMGMNSGDSAEMVSNLVGKKHISKVHASQTKQESGTSSSFSPQVHDNELVITPDEINSFLGTRFTKVNGKPHGETTFLYLPGNEKDVFMLTLPVENYPVLYQAEPADWISGKTYKPSRITTQDIKKAVEGYGTSSVSSSGGSGGGVSMDKPKANPKGLYMEDKPVADAADEFELSPEELDALEMATQKEERSTYYQLPTEDENMQDTILKDVIGEVVGGGAVQTGLHLLDALGAKAKNLTTSRTKYHESWKKKEKKEGLDPLTKN
ncbi:TraM recognition domain-containing protein [Diaphorobacter aerolatus]|uniref:Type IV secretion system DNA-binding domain-containing protein n=1 Tax=Diaphorobacter aerolatus TaxID=1288495 RepID=A0A7H0GJB0_9BURK|nr:TraM recognition domain-containing protein [Diaphorobacter aerolatus]QNP48376.1 type IV secretion system DNA-binding domain-containing protein [Diaphorobacter aerolatus]